MPMKSYSYRLFFFELLFICLAVNTNTYRTTENREQPDVRRRKGVIRSFNRLHEKPIGKRKRRKENLTNIAVLYFSNYIHTHWS